MNKIILAKFKESVFSVLPITVIVLILNFAIHPMDSKNTVSFVIGALLLMAGMALYSLGVDTAITPVGNHIGNKVSHISKLGIILLNIAVIGFIVTIAEPDLSVLASQVSFNKWVLITVISAGVAVFMILAILRMVLNIGLHIIYICLYGLLFLFVALSSMDIIPLAFDSGGVTTGPITVPFILAISVGIGTVFGGRSSNDSSFGVIGICSVGPILCVLILNMFNNSTNSAEIARLITFESWGDVFLSYLKALPIFMKDVAIAIAPITIFFLIMNFTVLKLSKVSLLRISIGFIYTYIGLTIFLLGVNIGFMSTGAYIGAQIAHISKYLTIPIGMVVGGVIVLAEPAIHVLNKQVEEITNGIISHKTMFVIFIISMMLAVGLSMLRVATGISILYIIVPGYAIALGLTFFVPKIFTGIAFDSGGVASGPMSSTFLLPFAMGVCEEIGGNILADAFGTIGIIAMTPLITLQILGLVFKIRLNQQNKAISKAYDSLLAKEGEIIEFDLEDNVIEFNIEGSVA